MLCFFTCDNNILKKSVFFLGSLGEWIGARDKQIAWTAKRFSDDFPMNPEKRHSLLVLINKNPSYNYPL